MPESSDQPPEGGGSSLLGLLFSANLVIVEVLLVAMLGLVVVEVLLRSTVHISLQFADEVSAYLLVAVTFLGLGVSLRGGAMFRVEFLHRLLPERGRVVVELLFNTASLAFTLVLAYHLTMLTISSYQRDVLSQTLLRTPQFVPQIVMPIGMALLAVALVAMIAANVSGLVRRRRKGDEK